MYSKHISGQLVLPRLCVGDAFFIRSKRKHVAPVVVCSADVVAKIRLSVFGHHMSLMLAVYLFDRRGEMHIAPGGKTLERTTPKQNQRQCSKGIILAGCIITTCKKCAFAFISSRFVSFSSWAYRSCTYLSWNIGFMFPMVDLFAIYHWAGFRVSFRSSPISPDVLQCECFCIL